MLVFLVWVWVDSYATATKVHVGVFLVERGVPVRTRSSPDYKLRGESQVYCTRTGAIENGLVTVDYEGVSERQKNVMMIRQVGFARMNASPGLMLPSFHGFRQRNEGVKIAKVTLYHMEVPMWGIVGLYVVVFITVMMRWRRRMMRAWVEKTREAVRNMNAGR